MFIVDERINWSLTFNGRHQKQEYSKIGNKLDLINDGEENFFAALSGWCVADGYLGSAI
ncbi:MAG: hypothetical protein ACLU4N_13780 [Butyricimonas faecihominis]